MNKQDYIEDTLYLLLIRIKLIQDTLILNTDPEFFITKTLEDIDFINQILGVLLKKLEDNQQRIDREGLLEHLSDIEWQFSKVLSEVLNGSGNISAQEIPTLRDRISILLEASQERRKSAETLGNLMDINAEEPVTSSNELNELLRDL